MDDDNTGGGFSDDEYAALQDPRQVMPEVATVLAELHEAITQLGNAFTGAGLPAREWISDDALLRPLADNLPDVTLDDLLTRAAEFAAGSGPYWLRGGAEAIEQFVAETALLSDAFRPLRVIAQRLRVLPSRERGALPIERALGDGRVGAKLDQLSRCLADLEALGPFMAPLTPHEWSAARGDVPYGEADQFTEPLPPELIPSPPLPGPGSGPGQGAAAPVQPAPPPRVRGLNIMSVVASPVASLLPGTARPAAAGSPGAAAARPPRVAPPRVRRLTATLSGYAAQARQRVQRVEPRRWAVVGLVALLLALGTGVLALAAHPAAPTAPPGPLTVSPASVKLTCTGSGSSATVTLEWTGTAATTWSAGPATGLALSPSRGTLTPNTGIRITTRVTARKAAHGTLTFTAGTQRASVAYAVSCG